MLKQNVVHDFNTLPWHDASLTELKILRDALSNTDKIEIAVGFSVTSPVSLTAIIFLDCTMFIANIDLDGKRVCADSIASANCYIQSDLKRTLERGQLRDERNPLAEYYHFHIEMIPPGGALDIFARGFELSTNDSNVVNP